MVLRAAEAVGRSPAQVALNWLATQPGSTSPIVGARDAGQLAANLDAIEFELPAEIRAELDAVSALELVHPYSMFKPPLSVALSVGVQARAWRPAEV